METQAVALPVKKNRNYLPEVFDISSWETLQPFFEELKTRQINSAPALEKWLLDRSELEAVLAEELGWRYIRTSCDTLNQAYQKSYAFFLEEIDPKTAPYRNDFNKKLTESPFLKDLDKVKYHIYLRAIKRELEIYREQNIPLITEAQTESQKYGNTIALMTVNIEGEEITLQKASSYLENNDRNKRKEAFEKIQKRRLQEKKALNDLYDHLIDLRNTISKNAGFANYRDYMFASLGRFDYNKNDCFNFHESIVKEIMPLVNDNHLRIKKALGVEQLKPWDTSADVTGKPPLKPFKDGKDLIEKSILCFNKIRPFYGECLQTLRDSKHLDLDSRKGKAPGGFNYPLYETGIPFIFMNSVGTLSDVVTMVHEGGHAIHSILSKDLALTSFKELPSEVAELASMSMELISMEHWDIFFDNKEDLKRAKKDQLEKVVNILPWIAAVDKFQHWVYENPTHTVGERTTAWKAIMKQFGSQVIDWTDYEETLETLWQKQLHIYEVPFYYIEYGIAQLGAIAVWRNYKQDPEQALNNYEKALSLGYTSPISEIYETAGVKFDFSTTYIKELADFVKKEIEKL